MNGTLITKDGISFVELDDPWTEGYELVDTKTFFTNVIKIGDMNYRLFYNHYGEGFVSVNQEERSFRVQGNCLIIQTNITGALEAMSKDHYLEIVRSGIYQLNGFFTLTNFIVDDDYERRAAKYWADQEKLARELEKEKKKKH